jgi:hypothetical protein
MVFTNSSPVTIRGAWWRVPESSPPGAPDIGVVVLDDPQAFLKYGRTLLGEVLLERKAPGDFTSFTISKGKNQNFAVDTQVLGTKLTEDRHVRGVRYHHGSPAVDPITNNVIGVFTGGAEKVVYLSKEKLMQLNSMVSSVSKTIELSEEPTQLRLSSFVKDSGVRQLCLGSLRFI